MANQWRALRPGESASEHKKALERAYETFLHTTTAPEAKQLLSPESGLRRVVLDSWLRSREAWLDPKTRSHKLELLSANDLQEARQNHPLLSALPLVHRILCEEAAEAGLIVAVGDAEGRLLWVDGDKKTRQRAEDMGFIAGSNWSELAHGTSAPGSAIALNHAIQVMGAEHYDPAVHEWSCTAAPIHDPLTGNIIGVLDVTGGDEAAAPYLLPLLDATITAVETELRLQALQQPRIAKHSIAANRVSKPTLHVLGLDTAELEIGSSRLHLSGRHAEILLALSLAPRGLPSALLSEAVYGDTASEQTLRAEVVRLRRWLDSNHTGITIASRPYRINPEIKVDALEALNDISRGAHKRALSAYQGPVLPSSTAPVAEDLRDELESTLREALLQGGAADILFQFANRFAATDREVWHTLLQVLPPKSPKRATAVARLEAISG